MRVIYSQSAYETRRDYILRERTEEFRYPVIHSTPHKGIKTFYSSRNDLGHFGIPKVIFGDGCINPLIDMEGNYGMTQHAMALPIRSSKEGEIISKALKSQEFQEINKSTTFGNYRIEYRIFQWFKDKWWEEI